MIEESSVGQNVARSIPRAAIWLPLTANLFAILIWLPLLKAPSGSSIDIPMLPGIALFAMALPVALYGAVYAFVELPNGSRRWAGWFCFLFSYSPLGTGILTLRLLMFLKHLSVAPSR